MLYWRLDGIFGGLIVYKDGEIHIVTDKALLQILSMVRGIFKSSVVIVIGVSIRLIFTNRSLKRDIFIAHLLEDGLHNRNFYFSSSLRNSEYHAF